MWLEAGLGPVAPFVALGFPPDGRRLASAGFNGELNVWNLAARRQQAAALALRQTLRGLADQVGQRRGIRLGATS
jgi:hypothetical protein